MPQILRQVALLIAASWALVALSGCSDELRRNLSRGATDASVSADVDSSDSADVGGSDVPTQSKLGAVYSTGALPFEGACGVSDASGVRIQFAMTSSSQPALPIRQGTRLSDFTVDLPGNFNAASIEFASLAESRSNKAVVYPAPDVNCATDADCSNGMLCDLRARARTSGDTTRVCQLKTTLGQITSRPLAETRPPTAYTHDVLILFSNGSTILGANPNGTSNPDRQSDPNEYRTSSAYYLTSRLATIANLPNGLDEAVKVCVGYFNEPPV